MMLEYEWGNPAAAAAAMLLFGEETGPERQVFDHYGHHGGLPVGDLFAQQQHHLHHQQQQLSAAGLFTGSATGHQRYGLALPPASARIGLNLGVRTYFASGSPEEDLVVGRVCRRRTRMARCQAEGCGADLTHAKHYHRRHKVCEFHSKASIVIAAGLSQRFCQQCSRFHVLSEFDQGKRSCRKRLADHNRRRRKSQDLATTTATVTTHDNSTTAANTTTTIITTATTNNNDNTHNPEKVLFTATSSSSSNNNNNRATTTPSFFTEPSSSVTRVSSPAPPALPSAVPRMALGLGCNNVVTIPPATGLSGSSSSGTSPPSVCFLSHLGDFRSHEHRFPSWDEAEDGSSIRELFQSK